MVKGSAFLNAFFIALPLLLAAAFIVAVRVSAVRAGMDAGRVRRSTLLAAAGVGGWMAITGGAAAAGRLRFDTVPPTMMPVLLAMFVLAIGIGVSRVGRRIAAGVPLAVLVGAQGFRLPLELAMHRASAEGLMPEVMSYTGRNFDIVTGTLALLVAALLAAGRMPRRGVAAWNVVGALLLANVVTVAMLAAPTPMRVFTDGPANVWITAFPWIWLPTMMVPAAILGHILVFRRLRLDRAAEATRPAAPTQPRREAALA
ncbi:MAG TPA: hypothetical protein VFR81_09535 [Longimicrobium sp.]|nr:hypothetical protein [Longimicrobium sp.]